MRKVAIGDWTAAHDEAFARPSSVTMTGHPGIEIIPFQGDTLGIRIDMTTEIPVGFLEESGVVALSGGESLARWFAAGNRCESLRVLHLVLGDEVEGLAAAPGLADLRRLALWCADPRSLLASPHLELVDTLKIVLDPTHADCIATLPLLRNLELAAFHTRTPAIETLARLFTRSRAPLERLVIERLEIPIEALAGNDAFRIHTLHLRECPLRGAELFGAFTALGAVTASHASFDDAAVEALAKCERLVECDLAGAGISDAGVRHLLDARWLRRLDLRRTRVRDLAVLETLARLPTMKTLLVPDRPRIQLHVQQVPNLEAHGDLFSYLWRPKPATRSGGTDLPLPPPRFDRHFIRERDERCEFCDNQDDDCPQHVASESTRDHAAQPFDDWHGRFLAARDAMAAAETQVVAITDALGGTASHIVWSCGHDDKVRDSSRVPPSPILDDLRSGLELAIYWAWPFEAALAKPGAVASAIAEIHDLGFAVLAITEETVVLAYLED